MKRILICVLLCMFLLNGCGAMTPYPTNSPTLSPIATLNSFPIVTSTPTPTPWPILGPVRLYLHGTLKPTITPLPVRKDIFKVPQGWNIEEYELTEQTGISRDEYVRRHLGELGGEYNYVTGYDWTRPHYLNGKLLEITLTSLNGNNGLVQAIIDNKEVLRVETDPLGNVPCAIMSFWVYKGHWAIEILRRERNDVNSSLYEEIFIDGKSVLAVNHYERTFAASLIDDKLLYFFQRAGKLGFNYDGTEYLMDYNHVDYACCCGEGLLNPNRFLKAIGFNAKRNGRNYYVLMGLINP